MWLKISQLRLELDISDDPVVLAKELARRIQLKSTDIKQLKLLRKSLDARRKNLSYSCTLAFEIDLTLEKRNVLFSQYPEITEYMPETPMLSSKRRRKDAPRPIIVGAGPAGLFAGLRLAAAGFNPLILERGDSLVNRIQKVTAFWEKGVLDLESNIQYGIGGAGTFSDGKLTTRVKHPLVPEILQTLVRLGAPSEIIYCQYPHIGTDLLRLVVEGLERRIQDYGGEISYRQKLTDLHLTGANLTSITVNGEKNMDAELLILATGNSSRDIYELLYKKGIMLESKPFAVGVRIEHPQEIIDRAQYGQWFGHPKLGAAEYHLTYQHPSSARGVYSFCMCPGGVVVGATSEPRGVVTNGMSYHTRNSGIANAAIIATVSQKDFGTRSPLAGMLFQQQLERRAYEVGGGNYQAPAQRWEDFARKRSSHGFDKLPPSYRPGCRPANLWEVLPEEICEAIGEAIRAFGRKIKGFDWPDAVITGVETRTSAPVKIVRAETREAVNLTGIYPVGEGAGHSGGIISSALDGFKTAEAIIERFGE